MAKRSSKPRVPVARSDEDLRRARVAPAGGPTGDGRVRVRRETSGRRGKAATTISGLPADVLDGVAGRLKKRCGVGGAVKDGVIELQGDHREIVVDVLRGEGYDVVLAGG